LLIDGVGLQGLQQVREMVLARLEGLCFDIQRFASEGQEDVIVAVRAPGSRASEASWVGLSGHYDVEEAEHSDDTEVWASNPWEPTQRDGRVYCRGVGDNLGPLLLRLHALAQLPPHQHEELPGMVWVIHGDEEVGSPWAHEVYPTLELPPVQLWVEETGFFVNPGGMQRLLVMGSSPLLEACVRGATEQAALAGIQTQVQRRFMNKSGGLDACPFLRHIVKTQPYFAIGPNDTLTNIHRPNESVPMESLAFSALQFVDLLRTVATQDGAQPCAHATPRL
jgi:acetylornithine deacetylase/succinyl-diaminopimelate desuccinylase-like protein